jgi:hypothetical protein
MTTLSDVRDRLTDLLDYKQAHPVSGGIGTRILAVADAIDRLTPPNKAYVAFFGSYDDRLVQSVHVSLDSAQDGHLTQHNGHFAEWQLVDGKSLRYWHCVGAPAGDFGCEWSIEEHALIGRLA